MDKKDDTSNKKDEQDNKWCDKSHYCPNWSPDSKVCDRTHRRTDYRPSCFICHRHWCETCPLDIHLQFHKQFNFVMENSDKDNNVIHCHECLKKPGDQDKMQPPCKQCVQWVCENCVVKHDQRHVKEEEAEKAKELLSKKK